MYVVAQGMRVLVENSRNKHLAWVKAIMSFKGWTQTDLARHAGLDPSTLSRFFREVNPGATLQTHTVDKIAAVGGIPPFQTEPPQLPRGFAEQEAVPLQGGIPDDVTSRAVIAAKGGKNGLDPWVLKTRVLETAGYLPGDILMVDLNGEPEDGDVVCAQIFDRLDRPETIFRIYEEPYLVAASHDPLLRRPFHLSKDQVMVRGVVVTSIRPRKAA